CQHYFSSPFTF
nr:immunoglobulin light chain junction region [Macaca mulatta]